MQFIIITISSPVSLRTFHRSLWIIYLELLVKEEKKTLNGQEGDSPGKYPNMKPAVRMKDSLPNKTVRMKNFQTSSSELDLEMKPEEEQEKLDEDENSHSQVEEEKHKSRSGSIKTTCVVLLMRVG
ncbi:ankyrin repeat domain-containing protein 26-like isoform X2 [Odocoileus virginianus]|uniref:Ankyrin repeat domain-containing protein 26-like isoform X2 n=1 Tax=Odocoileus virginianus TaxID=9874 RepID=A0ABM4IKE5_ODOVR